MNNRTIECKYNLSPIAEVLSYDDPQGYAESIERIIIDYSIKILESQGYCTPMTQEACDLINLRSLREAFREMMEKEE